MWTCEMNNKSSYQKIGRKEVQVNKLNKNVIAISYDTNQLKTNININTHSTLMNMPKIYLHSQNYISDAAFLEEVPLTRSLSSNPSLPGCSDSAVSLPLGDWGKATMTQFTKAPLLLIWKLPLLRHTNLWSERRLGKNAVVFLQRKGCTLCRRSSLGPLRHYLKPQR